MSEANREEARWRAASVVAQRGTPADAIHTSPRPYPTRLPAPLFYFNLVHDILLPCMLCSSGCVALVTMDE